MSTIGAIVVDGRVYPAREEGSASGNGSGMKPGKSHENLASPPGDGRSYVAPPSPYQQLGQQLSPLGTPPNNMRPPTPSQTPPLSQRHRVSPLGQMPHVSSRCM